MREYPGVWDLKKMKFMNTREDKMKRVMMMTMSQEKEIVILMEMMTVMMM